MKPFLLALVEGAAVFSGVTAMTALWRPGGVDDVHLAAQILLQALVLSICCIVAFYYNDLYDLYIVRDFEMFLLRLVESLGVTIILIAVGVVIPLRAATYTIMRRPAFWSRVVIVGASDPVADLIRETRNRPNAGLSILGVGPIPR